MLDRRQAATRHTALPGKFSMRMGLWAQSWTLESVRIVHGPPEEIAVVRRIFRLFVREFRGATEIANILNADGVPYRRPGPWAEDRVKAVLKNEIAVGIFAFNRTRSSFGVIEYNTDKASWLRVKIVEPIVSRALFDAAQRKMADLKWRRYTDDDMIGKLHLLLKKDGYLCRSQIDASSLTQGSQAYIRRFGSLDAAMLKAGFKRTKRYGQHVDRLGLASDEILRRLRAVLKETGYLNTTLINRRADLPNASTVSKRFGGLAKAYGLVGYHQSRSAIIAAAWHRRRRSTI